MSRLPSENEVRSSTPRERAVRKRVSGTRARSTKAVVPPEAEIKEEVPKAKLKQSKATGIKKSDTEERKAPTPIAKTKYDLIYKRRRLIVVTAILGIGLGTSAMVGFTDSGRIDVNKTIEERNERIRNNQANESDLIRGSVEVPVQNTNISKPDGGLIGRGLSNTSAGAVPVPPEQTEEDSQESEDENAIAEDAEDADEGQEETIRDLENENVDGVNQPVSNQQLEQTEV